jgi:hypothetical protein
MALGRMRSGSGGNMELRSKIKVQKSKQIQGRSKIKNQSSKMRKGFELMREEK